MKPVNSQELLERLGETLRRIGLTFPYLVGLIQKIDVHLDERIDTIGIFASGRLVVNPKFVQPLSQQDLLFVLTHELYHLTLKTHERGEGSNQLDFNFAHDFIINDLLRQELQVGSIPAGGLDWWGASKMSAEALMGVMRREGTLPSRSWDPDSTFADLDFPEELGTNLDRASDVLDEATERRLFPALTRTLQSTQTRAVVESAASALGMQAMMETMRGRGDQAGEHHEMVSALRGLYRPPWELGLQRWLEAMAPSNRSYARPSRRGADRTDIVLPGRKREGWTLHIVLDTSGSMIEDIPAALGAIADFCDAMGVDEIHLIQCDAAIHTDEILSPAELSRWRITGYGGSDLRPALNRLAEQTGVEAVIVLTDGEIAYPEHALPYQVLWVLPAWQPVEAFQPPYGKVLSINGAGGVRA